MVGDGSVDGATRDPPSIMSAFRLWACIAFLALPALAVTAAAQDFDLVIRRGRVMDPESGLDEIRDVGIKGGTIQAVSTSPLAGKETIDVRA